MHLLERVLSTLPNIEASAIIAEEAGIHWKTIRRTAELVKYVTVHSPRSQGNFNFTALAMLKPFAPFFPGSCHTGAGRQFAQWGGYDSYESYLLPRVKFTMISVSTSTGWSFNL